jgi:hypothetical protein
MAHGNFFPSMQLEPGAGQEVCGPIIWAGRDPWDLPALEVELLVVVVTQFTGGDLVIGLTEGPTTFSHGSELQDEWETDVFDIHGSGTNKFQAGPAHGHAMVRVKLQGTRHVQQHIEFWNEPISFSL